MPTARANGDSLGRRGRGAIRKPTAELRLVVARALDAHRPLPEQASRELFVRKIAIENEVRTPARAPSAWDRLRAGKTTASASEAHGPHRSGAGC
jgi:hypothetical protein